MQLRRSCPPVSLTRKTVAERLMCGPLGWFSSLCSSANIPLGVVQTGKSEILPHVRFPIFLCLVHAQVLVCVYCQWHDHACDVTAPRVVPSTSFETYAALGSHLIDSRSGNPSAALHACVLVPSHFKFWGWMCRDIYLPARRPSLTRVQ